MNRPGGRSPRRVAPQLRRVRERHVLGPGLVVEEHRMALAEGPAAGVLAGESDVVAVGEHAAERERLAERPFDLSGGVQLGALVELASELGVDVEARRGLVDDGRERVEGRRGRRLWRRATAAAARSTGGAGRWSMRGGAAARVSSRAACSLAEKSSRARSASSMVMSPRFTSVSVYSLRTERCWSICRYMSGWV